MHVAAATLVMWKQDGGSFPAWYTIGAWGISKGCSNSKLLVVRPTHSSQSIGRMYQHLCVSVLENKCIAK